MASLLKFIYRWCFERIKNTTFFEKMKEMEERENELEERERRLEERERRHEMEDREYRRMGYESYPTDYYGDDRYYGDGPQMRRGRGRGRGRSY